MSLINDALKRANEAQKKRGPSGPLGAPLQPADMPPRRAPARSSWVPVLVPVIVVVLLGLAFWLIRSGVSGKKAEPVVVAVTAPVPQPMVQPLPPIQKAPTPAPVAPKPVEPPKPYISKSGIIVDTNIVVHEIPVAKPVSLEETTVAVPVVEPVVEKKAAPVTVASAKPVEPVKEEVKAVPTPAPAPKPDPAPAKPAFPDLKLQGIFFRLKSPTALISGKIVKPGDIIQGVKVVSIERSSLILEFGGERKTLEIGVQ